MSSNVTIDNIGIKVHERYAQDQFLLELKYITESHKIPHQSEIVSISALYSSKWEELFQIHIKNIPWAHFIPPPQYKSQRKKFFSYRLSPKINLMQEDEEEADEQADDFLDGEEIPESRVDLIKKMIFSQTNDLLSATLLEKNKTSLCCLLDSINFLCELLREVDSRKLQYQKG
ncbi:MAG: DUF5399 domain-containing protein [Chlamydiae bacterium]|nr:DUF5399 domain-containing protein [Chlamydiota bacterium]